jgi:hypothetical protein
MPTAESLRGATPMLEVVMPALSAGRLSSARAQRAGPAALADAFRSSGGVIGSDDLTQLLGRRSEQPISLLARWIVDRRVVHFKCNGQLVLPLFQFELPSLNVLPAVAEVIAELGGYFDDGQIAEWFAMPNCWLQGTSPAGMMVAQPTAVLQTARADRFALLG